MRRETSPGGRPRRPAPNPGSDSSAAVALVGAHRSTARTPAGRRTGRDREALCSLLHSLITSFSGSSDPTRHTDPAEPGKLSPPDRPIFHRSGVGIRRDAVAVRVGPATIRRLACAPESLNSKESDGVRDLSSSRGRSPTTPCVRGVRYQGRSRRVLDTGTSPGCPVRLARRSEASRRMNRRVPHLIAGWRTGLSRPVLILQAGNALNYFGYGLILPFEIIYLHQIRGFSTSTAGLVLAATTGTAAITTPTTGALLDRYSAKAIVVAGNLASALGYAGFAYVDHPWEAFACSVVSGVGLGLAGTANRTLTIRLVKREQRTAAFALNRVSGNFGIGSGATVAGFIVAFAQRLSSFPTLYFLDAVTYAAFALIVLAAVPSPRAETVTATDANGTGFRAVARDRPFLIVIAANIVLVVVGHTFFSNILPPFAIIHTPLGPAAIGI